MSLVIALLVVVLFFSFAIFGFRKFDAMVRHIYLTDKERWQKLGSPMGYFWIPKEKTPFFRSTHSRDALFFDFLAAGFREPIQPPQHNAGSRPSSGDSPASDAESSLGPRG